jgi:NADPH-dependent 2,4-dienoyl-CoA reductase/sulfur reductase-like enzyme
MEVREVIVVGAGGAGLSAALALKDRGVSSLVVDRAGEVGSSWRGRYDRLRLNSSRGLSHLPGRAYRKGTARFPTRDQVIEHLQHYASADRLELSLNTAVDRIDRRSGGWRVQTSGGELEASQVIVAAGYDHTPFVPDWPGRDEFDGRLLHASEYVNPDRFKGEHVLVVGPGCSGMEIAYDLAEGGAAKVWLSARTPPNIVMREGPAGIPGDVIALALLHTPTRFADGFERFGRRMDLGDLTAFGLPVPEEGVFARLRRLGVAPAIIDPEVIESIKEGNVEVVRGVESLEARGVRLEDGVRVEPDFVICATGHRRGLEGLVGHLKVLNHSGVPRALDAEPAAPGLRFLGYVPRPAMLGYAAKQARPLAKAIAAELRRGRAHKQSRQASDQGG